MSLNLRVSTLLDAGRSFTKFSRIGDGTILLDNPSDPGPPVWLSAFPTEGLVGSVTAVLPLGVLLLGGGDIDGSLIGSCLSFWSSFLGLFLVTNASITSFTS